jgi:hypothetical protein
VTDSADAAADEVRNFYRVYHSMRYVRGELVLRLQTPPSATTLDRVKKEFADLITGDTFEVCESLPEEVNEPTLRHLPRLKFRFNKHAHGRLRQLIDVLNAE